MKRLFLIGMLTTMLYSFALAGGIGIGVSGIYNFQTESFGAGLRMNIQPSNMFRIVPQVAYYPSFNKIHELYAGLGLELNLFKIKRFSFYLLGHGGYNSWLNWEESNMEDVKQHNWALEGGGGLAYNKGTIRPFIEYRYNVAWKETNLHIGLLFVPGSGKNNRYKRNNRRRYRPVSCPAYY